MGATRASLKGLGSALRRGALALACLGASALPAASVVPMGGGVTANSMAAALVGGGVTISNVTYQGAAGASGTFSGGLPVFGIASGVVLTCGSVLAVPGPNNNPAYSAGNSLPGDADLNVTAGINTNDASVLEFDFVPLTNQVSFQFVFGSEEYLEFVMSFNDAFAIYVNGVNVAKIPGTSQPVSIYNVNDVQNPAWFVDNTLATRDTQLDGFTLPMTAIANVNVGVVNHIKFAVADAVDTSLDTVVLIKAGSLTAYTPTPSITRTYTPGPTRTVTPSSTISPTFSVTQTPTLSPSFSITPSFTHSPTITMTPTITPTFTITQTFSHSPTLTPTPTATPTFTVTSTFSHSPTHSATPTVSPSCTVTVTYTETPEPLLLTPKYPNPNPARNEMWIPYVLSVDAQVDIKVYDVAGELVRRFDALPRPKGANEEYWDLRNSAGQPVASGIFLYRIHARSPVGEDDDVWMKCAVSR